MLQILKLTWTFLTLLIQSRYFPTRKVHFLSTKLMFLIMTLLCRQSKVLQRAPRAGNLCKIGSERGLGVAETCRLSMQNLRIRVDWVWEWLVTSVQIVQSGSVAAAAAWPHQKRSQSVQAWVLACLAEACWIESFRHCVFMVALWDRCSYHLCVEELSEAEKLTVSSHYFI